MNSHPCVAFTAYMPYTHILLRNHSSPPVVTLRTASIKYPDESSVENLSGPRVEKGVETPASNDGDDQGRLSEIPDSRQKRQDLLCFRIPCNSSKLFGKERRQICAPMRNTVLAKKIPVHTLAGFLNPSPGG